MKSFFRTILGIKKQPNKEVKKNPYNGIGLNVSETEKRRQYDDYLTYLMFANAMQNDSNLSATTAKTDDSIKGFDGGFGGGSFSGSGAGGEWSDNNSHVSNNSGDDYSYNTYTSNHSDNDSHSSYGSYDSGSSNDYSSSDSGSYSSCD